MRKRAKQILGWGHGGVLLSIVSPIVYGLAIQGEAAYEMGIVWLLNLLILPVIVVTDLLLRRCRQMGSYLFLAALCAALVNLACWRLHGFVGEEELMDVGAGVVVILVLESVLVFVERILIRLYDKKSEDRQEENPDWRPRESMLTRPKTGYTALLVFAYGVGKFCNNPPLCDIAFGLVPVYLCITFWYDYLDKTEEYLSMNKRVCNLPRKRLYGINGGVCLGFLTGIVCLAILSGMIASHRNYQDIRGLLKGEADIFGESYMQLWEELTIEPAGKKGIPYMMEAGEPPAWIKMLEKGAAAAAVVLTALLGMYGLRKMAGLFRDTFDENGDLVEDLYEEQDMTEPIRTTRIFKERMTEAERVRRQYRRTIRKYRKDRPGQHETPYEIEKGAGIAGTQEGQQLHEGYERARYHV